QEAPARPDDDLGEHVGHEDEHADDRPAADLLVQQERERDGSGPLEDQGEHDDVAAVQQRVVERGVPEDRQVVVEPDELGRRPEALPLEEPVVGRHHDGEDDEHQEHDDGRCREHDDLERLAPVGPLAPSRPGGRGRRLHAAPCHHGSLRRGGPGRCVLAQGVSHVPGYSIAAAALTASTMLCGSSSPASISTTPALRALPTFWPYSVSSQTDTYGASLYASSTDCSAGSVTTPCASLLAGRVTKASA